ncbi:DUF2975 domain-containing protein [Mucilaginibacter sp. ZT4R22]|uniref:DUF2975 domain-containing protein n=1 Tax=Mucilaginibacter pankratovii TaxID=2772110 RepID=A0ABR7WTS2_9SPHI|nr:DUF2975 domain-containing protein [Mucilaginibacter pankratovii]MBD1365705.1 DUF2975 domain-containing protein [Mucilaginibacter pankratovii]
MKIKFNTNRLVNATVIIVFVLLATQFYLLFTHTTVPGLYNHDTYSYSATNNLKPIDPYISTELPHNKYEALKRNSEVARSFKNGEWFGSGGAQLGWFLATDGGQLCDTCTADGFFAGAKGVQQYYIRLPGWKLNPCAAEHRGLIPSEFYVERGQSYVRKFVTDKVEKMANGNHYTVHRVDVPVKFRYNSKENCMMIPVSSSTKDGVTYLLTGLGILLFIYIFYLIAAFLKFIIDVSKGLSFTANNVKRLRLIAFSLLGFPVLMLLLTLLTRLVFNSYFTSDIVLNGDVWSKSWPGLAAGIIFLLLFKAFRQGKALKEENDLTV